MCKQLNSFDQFYTKADVSVSCCQKLKAVMGDYIDETQMFLEPSAGTGAFVKAVKDVFGDDKTIIAYDIDPKNKDIIKKDFLSLQRLQNHLVTIGNPPFGKRSKLAIDFFNKAARHSDIIAFIVPLQFDKYSVQSKLDPAFKLIHSEKLPSDSFIWNKKSYSVRCCFQIWTRLDTPYANVRILTKPQTKCEDFDMFLYNNTPETKKYFDKSAFGWDFAIPRQGYYDYSIRINNPDELKSNVQYMFFKINTDRAKDILLSIDFDALSKNNTTVPGYGKADVIQRYREVVYA